MAREEGRRVVDPARPAQEKIISAVQAWQESGGLTGRVLLAVHASR